MKKKKLKKSTRVNRKFDEDFTAKANAYKAALDAGEGYFVFKARQRAKLTQGELGRKLRVSGQLISNVERGICKLPPKLMVRFCKVTGGDFDNFCGVKVKDFSDELRGLLRG